MLYEPLERRARSPVVVTFAVHILRQRRGCRSRLLPVTFNLHRFGPDWDAVGRLINGNLPDDDEERWQMLAAPEHRIRSLLSRHSTAQAVLRACLGGGPPFALFLRSFASEAHLTREGQIFASHVVTNSVHFQRAIRDTFNARGIPLVKLHGGSDPLFSQDDEAELSTHSDDWEAVATELIGAAATTVVLLGALSAGVVRELDLIRAAGRTDTCVVALADPDAAPGGDPASGGDLRAAVAGFEHVFAVPVMQTGDPLPDAIARALNDFVGDRRTTTGLDHALNALQDRSEQRHRLEQ